MASIPNGSKKRRREPVSVDVKLVEIYEDLASENDEIRLKAAQALVSRFTPDQSPTDEQIEKALQRLFRGLCSGRKAARIGFSIALTEILSQVFSPAAEANASNINVGSVIGILESHSIPGGSVSGQEERDHHFGRLFGAEAILKSYVLFQSGVPAEGPARVFASIFDLAKKKPWLREECGWIVFGCVQDLCARKADLIYVENVLEQLCSNDLARTPEGVAIWLTVKDLFPDAKLPSGVWQHEDPLYIKEKRNLSKVMKEAWASEESSTKEPGNSRLSGVWSSKLHFAWETILARLYSQGSQDKRSKSSKSTRISFADFWTEVVDDGLFAASSSEERKYSGFLLFMKVLDSAPEQLAAATFTKNLMRCMMNQMAVEDRYLHRMALKAAKAIQTRVAKTREFAAAAVTGLMGPSGAINFDQITKSKTIEKIISDADLASLKEIIPLFEGFIANPGVDDSKLAASNRQLIANLLLSVVRSQSSNKGTDPEDLEDVMKSILLVLVRFSYFVDEGDSETGRSAPKPQLTQATQELFRSRIMSCLNTLINNRSSPGTLPYTVVRNIYEKERAEGSGKFVIEMDDNIRESVDSAFKTLKKIAHKEKKSKSKESSTIQAFKLLYSMTILQIYNGDGDAVSMLDELKFCYSKFLGNKKSDQEEASDASDALVEILLSFASKPSQLFRRMSEQVFGAFADQVTADGLQSLISVLETKENLAGQQEMFDQQDEDGDEEMADADDSGSDDDDVEEIDADDMASEEGSDEDSDSDSASDDAAENDDELAIFDAKLAEALGTHRGDEDLNADSNDSSDSDMGDDEMEALDDQLVKVFQARSQATVKKKDKKDAKETMINFKNRVLDLLEIYVKRCHSSALALDLLLPLLGLIRRSTIKQISTKASNVLREYTKLCKGTTGIPTIDDAEPVWELLKAVHQEAMHSGPPSHSASCSQASLLLVKTLVAHDKEAVSGVVDVYGETRKKQLLSAKCHVQPSFFTDWSNWCVSASKQLKG
ncbi:DNA-directed DNA polymerase [Arachnomyces sp. PD_36]|nr:DNA-directed DNA polymerase [Arachnomyces sp. PD_36]